MDEQVETAKKSRKSRSLRGNTSQYFRTFYENNPELLDAKTNEPALAQWKADNPNFSDADLTTIRQRLANLKTTLRKQRNGSSDIVRKMQSPTVARGGSSISLETLEEHIDNCLSMARSMEYAGLDNVVNNLKQARNEVIVRMSR